MQNEDIHLNALMVLGTDEALSKLRSETIELAHAIDKLLERKCGVDQVVHEFRDVLFVWDRVKLISEFKDELKSHCVHVLVAERKLQHAINCKIEENKQ